MLEDEILKYLFNNFSIKAYFGSFNHLIVDLGYGSIFIIGITTKHVINEHIIDLKDPKFFEYLGIHAKNVNNNRTKQNN